MTNGRSAIVTGGSSGIGLSIARVLAEEGHSLTLVARRPEPLEAAAAELRQSGADVLVFPAQLGDAEVPDALVAAHHDRFGRLDVLVNNAGVGVSAPITEMADRRIELLLDVNLRSVFRMYRAATPLLREAASEHRGALVVNTSSASGKNPEPLLSVYSATKAAVIAFTHAMNKELGGDGIKSCALCPGFVDTPITEYAHEQVRPEDMIRPEDVAEIVRALLKLSPNCVIPEVDFQRPGGLTW
jgi:NAD(P)-dependent dehydrogenase (short-subunit alcohol dehydrogenase family)